MKRLQIKITPENGGTKQAMKLTVVHLELRNKLQNKGYALQEDRYTAGSRILWLWISLDKGR